MHCTRTWRALSKDFTRLWGLFFAVFLAAGQSYIFSTFLHLETILLFNALFFVLSHTFIFWNIYPLSRFKSLYGEIRHILVLSQKELSRCSLGVRSSWFVRCSILEYQFYFVPFSAICSNSSKALLCIRFI